LAFTSPAARAFTVPSIRTHHSERSLSMSAKAGLSGSHSTCVVP
jgi:hypothetical protein